MKLRGIHILLILILSLLLCRCFLSNTVEGLESKIEHDEYTGPAGDHVDTYKNVDVDIHMEYLDRKYRKKIKIYIF